MKLTVVKRNTCDLEGEELIPLYKVGEDKCILLDTGLLIERQELEDSLHEYGLTPIGVLTSHAHVDHCANNGYLQEKYGTKIAMTFPEAGMCSTIMTLKCYFLTLTPGIVEQDSSCMVHRPDVIVPDTDGEFAFCGVTFRIVHTPGHSSGHIAIITPDNVCYVGDALLSRDRQNAKLPYALHHTAARASRDKLARETACDYYIMAHRGICTGADLPSLVRDNNDLFLRRAEEILALIDTPMPFSTIDQKVCAHYSLLTRQPRRALRFERNVRFFVEFLADEGYLNMECVEGTVYYSRSGKKF
jgi:glyoxylase-like metal-dependent hydrolase (beta-lactamase superfamily II)